MSYHEENPWREPQRTTRTRGRVVLGCLFALAVLIVLAVMEIQAAAVIAGLALVTGLVLIVGAKISQHRSP